MKRRNFIKLSTYCAMYLTLGGYSTLLSAAENTTTPKTIVNVMLDGGPDFRYLIVPAYESNNNDETSYAAQFWKARASLFDKTTPSELKAVYLSKYDEVEMNGIRFGILKQCSWLRDEIVAGNVAIISNVIGSTNRNHHHSKLILESGNIAADVHNQDVSGWAGRAAKKLNANVLSLTQEVRLVCNGPHLSDSTKHDNTCVINNFDSRNIGLSNYDTQYDLDNAISDYKWSEKAILSRSLSSYYLAKAPYIKVSSPYNKAMQHEKQVRHFGELLQSRLDTIAIPTTITQLLKGGANALDSSSFSKQMLSLYDSYASQDILNMRLASLEYKGWDSHKNLSSQIEPKFEDMFGSTKGFDTLTSEIKLLKSDSYANSAIVIAGEFGRQLKSNGDHGNDHGRGNFALVIGAKVNGGFYGNPFPSYETDKLQIKNKDIEGKTSMFQLYASLLNWQQASLGSEVFDLSGQLVESGVNLVNLMRV